MNTYLKITYNKQQDRYIKEEITYDVFQQQSRTGYVKISEGYFKNDTPQKTIYLQEIKTQ